MMVQHFNVQMIIEGVMFIDVICCKFVIVVSHYSANHLAGGRIDYIFLVVSKVHLARSLVIQRNVGELTQKGLAIEIEGLVSETQSHSCAEIHSA